MVSPVMVPLSVLYSSPLHLHQPLMVSPSVGHDDDHHRSREHRKGEGAFIVFFVFFYGNYLGTRDAQNNSCKKLFVVLIFKLT